MTDCSPRFQTCDANFADVLGPHPRIRLRLQHNEYDWAHEACVFVPATGDVFVTSKPVIITRNRIINAADKDNQKIIITKINIPGASGVKSHPIMQELAHTDIVMANGGTNYKDGILFCSQGDLTRHGGLWYMDACPPHKSTALLTSFNGRPFNSPNDVVVHPVDGSIWFTDPVYGSEQGFRPPPQLPNQVYRYDPARRSVRAVADGFDRPNGLCFSPDLTTLYVTDTGYIQGNGTTSFQRPASIYAFDVITKFDQPFLASRRLFAMADNGVPDGIKTDKAGNVYSGCGDGIHVWSAGGVLLGKILIPGGVANFCFCRPGEIMALNETRVWQVTLADWRIGLILKV
ncbi:gluconolactonase [Microdochium nivale]|nr:gluconolactonase [Microdochium nivale]